MGSCAVVRGGVDDALVCPCLPHVRADGGEGGGEVVEGLVECSARVSDEKDDNSTLP
jgi:hypothetical protein